MKTFGISRRNFLKVTAAGAALVSWPSAHSGAAAAAVGAEAPAEVECWGIFELALKGPTAGNPFADVTFAATFKFAGRAVECHGFYDGGGVYRVRFMPDAVGAWTYVTHSNAGELDGKAGRFTCVTPAAGNHGPVRVRNTFHFAYADGAPYRQIGTTCYAWTHQGDALEEQTLATLRTAPFNKMRMCIFPKSYDFNKNEPPCYPFEGTPPKNWDFTRFNPEYFRRQEKRIGQLRGLGIEADLILFHPYDRWGFAKMDAAADDRYLKYVVARLAAFRNVWWSMANEYDLMKEKKMEDWDRFFQIVQAADPYGRLRSVHNCRGFYDHTKPWVTHASVQSSDFKSPRKWREQYKKPVIYDECKYEGNIKQGWGKISAEEMVHRFWLGTVAGCYVGHGETYADPQDILWWSKGGVLHGQSPARIAFLKKILEESPATGLDPVEQPWAGQFFAGKEGEYYLGYFGDEKPAKWALELPKGARFQAEIIDTWAMTVTTAPAALEGACEVALPGSPRLALRVRKVR